MILLRRWKQLANSNWQLAKSKNCLTAKDARDLAKCAMEFLAILAEFLASFVDKIFGDQWARVGALIKPINIR